jgi:hypothetical protein
MEEVGGLLWCVGASLLASVLVWPTFRGWMPEEGNESSWPVWWLGLAAGFSAGCVLMHFGGRLL